MPTIPGEQFDPVPSPVQPRNQLQQALDAARQQARRARQLAGIQDARQDADPQAKPNQDALTFAVGYPWGSFWRDNPAPTQRRPADDKARTRSTTAGASATGGPGGAWA